MALETHECIQFTPYINGHTLSGVKEQKYLGVIVNLKLSQQTILPYNEGNKFKSQHDQDAFRTNHVNSFLHY